MSTDEPHQIAALRPRLLLQRPEHRPERAGVLPTVDHVAQHHDLVGARRPKHGGPRNTMRKILLPFSLDPGNPKELLSFRECPVYFSGLN